MPTVHSVAPETTPVTAGRVIALGALLVAAAFLPGFFFFLGASSLATGTAITAAAIIAADLIGALGRVPTDKTGILGVLAALAIVMGLHLFVGMALTGQGDGGRALLSFVILVLMSIAAWVLAARVLVIGEVATDRMMFGLLGLFALAALLSIAGVQPPSPRGILAKSVFPFSEPSHYAFSVAPLIIFSCLRLPFVPRGLVIAAFFAIAYALQSLSLVVVVMFAAVLTLPVAWLALAVAVVISLMTFLDIQYFTDRLDFSAQSTNVSSLIYIQGIELAQSGLSETHGWGIGFQQLGVGEVHSLTANAIAAILSEDSNIYDGGFTGAKLIAEFGVFGMACVTAYVAMAIRTAFRIRREITRARLPAAEAFFAAALLGFLIELFVRGAGYFTGTSMLALAAIFYFARNVGATRREAAVVTRQPPSGRGAQA